MVNEERNCFIALFDILGFKRMLERSGHKLKNFVSNFSTSFHRDLINNIDNFPGNIIYSENGTYRRAIRTMIYSDSVILYSGGEDELDFAYMITYSGMLVYSAIQLGFPLRGAITYGNCIITDSFILGNPIVKAYDLEQSQDWAGCIIDKDLLRDYSYLSKLSKQEKERMERRLNALIADTLILKYEIPKKCGEVTEDWALNWPWYTNTSCQCFSEDAIRNYFLQLHEKPYKINWPEERKIRNTIDFCNYSYQQWISLSKKWMPSNSEQ